MNLSLIIKNVLLALFFALVGVGCGGFSAEKSVSPLDFLMPHFGESKPDQNAPVNKPPTQPVEFAKAN